MFLMPVEFLMPVAFLMLRLLSSGYMDIKLKLMYLMGFNRTGQS